MKPDDIYTEHEPKTVIINGLKIYVKTEKDDNFFFRKTKSISINAKLLEEHDGVLIHILHRDVTVKATKEMIKNQKMVKTFNGEVKYYLPIVNWVVQSGDKDWVRAYIPLSGV